MEYALMVVGGLWAFLGVANILRLVTAANSEGVAQLGLIINFFVFIAPGLVLAAIGGFLRNRNQEREEEADRQRARLRARENDIENRVARGIAQGLQKPSSPVDPKEPPRRRFR